MKGFRLPAALAAFLFAFCATIGLSSSATADHCVYSGGGWLCTGPGDPQHQDPPFDRLGGADRYETSALIATYDQPEGTVLIVASSLGIDAQAAGTHLNGPMVLVPHGGQTVPDAVTQAAFDLAPSRVIVLGGEATVTPAQVEAIRAYAYEGSK